MLQSLAMIMLTARAGALRWSGSARRTFFSRAAGKMIDFDVVGVRYSIAEPDIEKYPDSYLAKLIKQERSEKDKPVRIDRDGNFFRYVYGFLVNGHIPDQITQEHNKQLFNAIRAEAEFFKMPELMNACNQKSAEAEDVFGALNVFSTIRDYVKRGKGKFIDLDYPRDDRNTLAKILQPVWEPITYYSRGVLRSS